MAKVKIAPQATGAGTTTLQAGTSASDYTLTLPDITDTIVTKTSTDTLTNKTLTTPTIDGGASATGTFTPTLVGFGGTGLSATGSYVKVGKMVSVLITISGTNVTSTNGGTSNITNMPFTASGIWIGSMINQAATSGGQCYINSTFLGAGVSIAATSNIYISITYQATA